MSMSNVKRSRFSGPNLPYLGFSVFIAALAGGCSADLSRFNYPSSFNFNDDQTSTATGAIGAPTDPVQERSNLGGNDGGTYAAAQPAPSSSAYEPPAAANSVQISALPAAPAAPSQHYTTAAGPDSSTPSGASWEQRPAPILDSSRPPLSAGSASGETIEVQSGDTLYGLAKRHRVSLNELVSVNGLSGTNLKPGQKLILPASQPTREAALQPSGVASDARPSTWRPNAEPQAATAEPAPADWTGTYVVKGGDSLYAIARANNLKFTDLQRYNGITDVRRVRPGTVLKVPASASNVAAGPTSATAPSNLPTTSVAEASPPPVAPQVQQPTTILNSTERVAANQTSTATDAAPTQPATGTSKLRWPVQGKIIAGFGQRPDGTHNDGINLAVPMGADVHAAEDGVVAYAGDELKGYGNLILLRHDNGWVTAYAHSEELMVKRGDKVKRGQVIAKAGKTGQVDQPQVHFELRQGQRPVDPTPYLERL